jgi:hypothetical protein
MQTPKHTAAKVALTVIFLGTAATGVRTQLMNGSDMMGKATSAVNSWPVDSQKAAKNVIAKYGAPHEATASMKSMVRRMKMMEKQKMMSMR